MGGGDFTVTVSRKEVVAAVLPVQEYWLPLSNLDLLLPPVDVGVFFCYKKPHDLTFGSMIGVLKEALAQALVSYYPFGGEVLSNSAGEPELLCNNRGVDFMEAYADVQLQNLNLYNPDESIESKLVPKKKHGVLSVQVTELKCGGVVVACTFDHRIADAYSANMFLVSWAEMAQSKPLSVLPSFRRSLLNARRPGSYDPSLDDMYVPMSTLPPPKAPQSGDDLLINRLYLSQPNSSVYSNH
uniref:Shikimate O-hydroxycinnamoyltransferase n=1 Tax=Vitis vinifera TaxID=29760 RepID=F6HS96_VITVI